jgi:hypothetical protein
MLDDSLLGYILFGALGLFGLGLLYFIFLGVRAIYREARRTARAAGHQQAGAAVRAVLRMTVWALFFGAYYLFAYFLGRRLGWWAIAPSVVGLIAMIWALLQADRLLTVPADDLRGQLGIGAALAALLTVFASVIWFAAQSD